MECFFFPCQSFAILNEFLWAFSIHSLTSSFCICPVLRIPVSFLFSLLSVSSFRSFYNIYPILEPSPVKTCSFCSFFYICRCLPYFFNIFPFYSDHRSFYLNLCSSDNLCSSRYFISKVVLYDYTIPFYTYHHWEVA